MFCSYYLFGHVVCRHHDDVKSNGVLQQPHANECNRPGAAPHEVVHFVVNIEQRHRAQGDQRHAHRQAEQIEQRVDGVPDQPVSDPYHFYGVGDRMFP